MWLLGGNQKNDVWYSTGLGAVEEAGTGVGRPLDIAEFHPSPFRTYVEIAYELPEAALVSVVVCNAAGTVVRKLTSGMQQAGRHSVRWDGRDDAGRHSQAGMYFCRLVAGDRTLTRKMVKAD